MKLMEATDYKKVLKIKVKEGPRPGSRLTWKKIAERIDVQYTYLSRTLNRDDVHMSEDHLHEICKLLQLMPDETEYLLSLRGLATAGSQARKDYLTKKIQALRQAKRINAPAEQGSLASGEIHFVLSPLAWVTYFALGIKRQRENVRRLAPLLGIDVGQLKGILHSLHDLGLIEIENDIFNVIKVNKNHFHYGLEHPLTRLHQQALRLACDAHFQKLPEGKRQRFMVTFNADESCHRKIEELFNQFILEVEKQVVKAPSQATYQMNFELFPWF